MIQQQSTEDMMLIKPPIIPQRSCSWVRKSATESDFHLALTSSHLFCPLESKGIL